MAAERWLPNKSGLHCNSKVIWQPPEIWLERKITLQSGPFYERWGVLNIKVTYVSVQSVTPHRYLCKMSILA